MREIMDFLSALNVDKVTFIRATEPFNMKKSHIRGIFLVKISNIISVHTNLMLIICPLQAQ